MRDRDASSVARVLAVIGAALVTVTGAVGSGFSPMAVPFLLWACVPYLALALAPRGITSPWAIGGAGLAGLAVEVGVRASVFLFPRGSTAAIALVFSPVLVLAVAMPTGAGAGLVAGWCWSRGGVVVRGALAALGVSLLGLTVLGFARPDLFPTAVVARRQALQEVGDPRILTGADLFESLTITDEPAWFLTGDFDQRPGDDIAVVHGDRIEIRDAATLQSVERIPYASPGRVRWTWSSRLIRTAQGLAVANTGGGYQDTELHGLDGATIWRYRPDPDLPPSSLNPADLDGDGATEFYAAATRHVARLDDAGREVWRRPASMAAIVGLAARTSAGPTWIAGLEYGRRIIVWDEAGAVLGERAWAVEDGSVLGVVDWRDERALAIATPTRVYGLTLDGRDLFSFPNAPSMAVSQVAVVRQEDGSALLAVVSHAPRDVPRSRLQIVAPDMQVLYDEVRARPLRLLVARRASGDVLLVQDSGLAVLRRRRS